MTTGPGASVYMPPEATAPAASNIQMSKYDASVDIFSIGVVSIFTIGEIFPCDPLAPTFADEKSGVVVARTELQRRSHYMRNVNEQLRACGQLRGDHPLIRLIQQCLQNFPSKRPGIREVLRLLEEARAGVRDEGSERNKRELVRALQTQPRNQETELVQAKDREMPLLQQQLGEKEQQIQEMRQRETELVPAKDREMPLLQQQLG
ncbi:hypothetical protein GBAR_LOCUS25462, partial [Geodia barretti]